jgi:hypothetical protein
MMSYYWSLWLLYSVYLCSGWRLWLAVFPVLYLCHDTACILVGTLLYIMCTCHHSPHLLLFVLGAAMRGHLVRTAIFVPHITPVRTICTAAPCELLLLSFTTSGGMFLAAFSTLKALLPEKINTLIELNFT